MEGFSDSPGSRAVEPRPHPAPAAAAAPRRFSRVVGRWEGDPKGPLLLVTGGIHGNEPAGLLAAERMFLEAGETAPGGFHGTLAVLAGNLPALERGVRYLDEDLNRIWLAERMAAPADAPSVEERQRDALRSALRAEVERHRARAAAAGVEPGEVHFMDLHTSSAPGLPFGLIGDTLRNRRFARALPSPIILGLEEQVDGALLEWLNQRGVVTLGFEGGQHETGEAVDNHAAALWLGMAAAGCLGPGHEKPWKSPHAEVRESWRRLASQAEGLPRFLEIRYRHPVRAEDGFRMRPGYRSFQRVVRGEVLAYDREGPIRAFYDARILLPLYQEKGADGFFLARGLSRFWLGVSAALRRLRCDRCVTLLPGVHRARRDDPDCPLPRHLEDEDLTHYLFVDPRVARWFTIEVFHLLGYRKRRSHDRCLVVSRRSWDLAGPERVEL